MQIFFCELGEIVKSTFSQNTSERLPLEISRIKKSVKQIEFGFANWYHNFNSTTFCLKYILV